MPSCAIFPQVQFVLATLKGASHTTDFFYPTCVVNSCFDIITRWCDVILFHIEQACFLVILQFFQGVILVCFGHACKKMRCFQWDLVFSFWWICGHAGHWPKQWKSARASVLTTRAIRHPNAINLFSQQSSNNNHGQTQGIDSRSMRVGGNTFPNANAIWSTQPTQGNNKHSSSNQACQQPFSLQQPPKTKVRAKANDVAKTTALSEATIV